MKRMIFRASKGRACMQTFDMEEKEDSHKRKIFLLVFPGSAEGVLMNKLIKICDIFNASRYKVPSINEFNIEFPQLEAEIRQKKHILEESKNSAIKFLKENTNDVIH